jgi:hypothetical protein
VPSARLYPPTHTRERSPAPGRSSSSDALYLFDRGREAPTRWTVARSRCQARPDVFFVAMLTVESNRNASHRRYANRFHLAAFAARQASVFTFTHAGASPSTYGASRRFATTPSIPIASPPASSASPSS